MTNEERLTLGRVLVEIGNLRTEFNEHFSRLDDHLTDQDNRLRAVEILTAAQQSVDNERQKNLDQKVAAVAEARVGKRWLVGIAVSIVLATVSSIVALLRIFLPPGSM